MKIALRMDDITADMNWDNFFRLKELFDKAGVRPLLGVVPDNRDVDLEGYDSADPFADSDLPVKQVEVSSGQTNDSDQP